MYSGPDVAIGDALRMAKLEFKNHSNEDVDPINGKIVWLYSSGNQNNGVDPLPEATFLKQNYKGKAAFRRKNFWVIFLAKVARHCLRLSNNSEKLHSLTVLPVCRY